MIEIRSWRDITIIDHSNDPTSTALVSRLCHWYACQLESLFSSGETQETASATGILIQVGRGNGASNLCKKLSDIATTKVSIRLTSFSDHVTNNILDSQVTNNTKCFQVPSSRTEPYRQSFFCQNHSWLESLGTWQMTLLLQLMLSGTVWRTYNPVYRSLRTHPLCVYTSFVLVLQRNSRSRQWQAIVPSIVSIKLPCEMEIQYCH